MFSRTLQQYFTIFLILIVFTVDKIDGIDNTDITDPLKTLPENQRLELLQRVENIARDLSSNIDYARNHLNQFTPQHQLDIRNLYNSWQSDVIRCLGIIFVQSGRKISPNDLLNHPNDLLPHAEHLRESLGNIMIIERERIRALEVSGQVGSTQPGVQRQTVQGIQGQVISEPPGQMRLEGSGLARLGGSGQGQKRSGDHEQGGQGKRKPPSG